MASNDQEQILCNSIAIRNSISISANSIIKQVQHNKMIQ